MWVVRPLSFLGLIGLFNYPQLSLSAGIGRTGVRSCSDDLCGENGAGSCVSAPGGYICLCHEGFTATLLTTGAACVNTNEQEGTLPGQGVDEGVEGTPESGAGTGGPEDIPLVPPPASDDHGQGGVGDGEEPTRQPGEPEAPHLDVTGPCAENPCGDPEAGTCVLAENGYACICNAGYISVNFDGQQLCANLGDIVCADNPCKNGNCVPLGDTYRCDCGEGYHSTVQTDDGNPTCVPDIDGDVCREGSCGPSEGVRGCATGANGEKICVCNSGFVATTESDGTTQCTKESTLLLPGAPMGPPGEPSTPEFPPQGTQEGGLTEPERGEHEGGEEPGTEVHEGGDILTGERHGPETESGGGYGRGDSAAGGYGGGMQARGAADGAEGGTAAGTGGAPDETGSQGEAAGGVGGVAGAAGGAAGGGTEEGDHGKEGGGNGTLIAGGVIGAIVLAAAAGGGAAMYKHSHGTGDSSTSDEVDFEQSGREGMVEVEPDESEILINVTNSDWAS